MKKWLNMGYKNISVILIRQLYAHGSVTVKSVAEFVQKKAAPLIKRVDALEAKIQPINAEISHITHSLAATHNNSLLMHDDLQELEANKQELKKLQAKRDEVKHKLYDFAIDASCEYDSIAMGLDEILAYFEDQCVITPVLDTQEKADIYNQWKQDGTPEQVGPGITDHYQLFDSIEWKWAPGGRSKYVAHQIKYVNN
jgi:hypothetical protein